MNSIKASLLKQIISFRSELRLRKELKRLEDKIHDRVVASDCPALSMAELDEINSFWRPYIKHEVGANFYRLLVKNYPPHTLNCQLHEFINEQIIYPFMIEKLNPPYYAKVLANKGLYNIIFKGVRRPYEVTYNCAGCYYDNNGSNITFDECVHLIFQEKSNLIIKASTDTYGGFGVKIFNSSDKQNVIDILKSYNKDFVIQRFIKQSDQTSIFNPTSLNTFRVTSLLLNGKCTVLNICMRCGGKGAKVDNASSGGVMVGVNFDGSFTNAATYKNLGIKQSECGVVFAEHKIDKIEDIIRFVEQLHYRVPYCAFVGWDICLDEGNNPVFIEGNMSCPGVDLEQICTGNPIFGDRLQEVLDYCFPK